MNSYEASHECETNQEAKFDTLGMKNLKGCVGRIGLGLGIGIDDIYQPPQRKKQGSISYERTPKKDTKVPT